MLEKPLFHHLKQLLEKSWLDPIRMQADRAYDQILAIPATQIPHRYYPPAGGVYVKQVASFTLEAVLGLEKSEEILTAFVQIPEIHSHLPDHFVINLDQCWVRRQFPASFSGHSPHSWHQDGALAFPFSDPGADYREGLLKMWVLWIPLCDGGDVAPGLEFIDFRQSEVRKLEALTDAKLTGEYSPSTFIKPVFKYGDVLVFDGQIIHRSYFMENMKNYRTSIGIRIFKEISDRCKNDRHLHF